MIDTTLSDELADGTRVDSMRVTGAGHNDLVMHTFNHFLQRAECWSEQEPATALSPQEAREVLEELGCSPFQFRGRVDSRYDSRWWGTPFLSSLLRIHGEGYWPRYRHAVRAAGSPRPGSKWVESGGRQHLRFLGLVIVAEQIPSERAVRVISAAWNRVLKKPSDAARQGSTTFADLFTEEIRHKLGLSSPSIEMDSNKPTLKTRASESPS